MKLQIHLRHQQYGKKCKACKKLGKVLTAQVWRGEKLLWNAQICQSCLEKGVTAHLTVEKEKIDNPIATKESKRRVKKSRDMEQALAEKVGGRAQPASGGTRLSGYKGDIRKIGTWRIEHKFTDALKEWVLRLPEMAKIINLAMEANEFPAMVVEFAKVKSSFAIIPLALFLEMINEDEKYKRPSRCR